MFLVCAFNVTFSAQSISAEPQANQQSAAPKSITYVLEPIAVKNVPYPQSAREKKIEGRISAQITVSETGDVENAKVFKGDSLLAQAAEEAVKQWKFKPVMKDGKAIPVLSEVTLNFVFASDDENSNGVTPQIAPAREFPLRVRVSEGVTQKLILSKTSPVYPPEAKAAGIQGTVLLRAIIGKDGSVSDLQLVSGPPALVQAAIDAARQWRYQPYTLGGRPVEVETQFQFSFTLR